MLPIMCRQMHLNHLNGGCARTAAQATRQIMLHDTIFGTDRVLSCGLILTCTCFLPKNIP